MSNWFRPRQDIRQRLRRFFDEQNIAHPVQAGQGYNPEWALRRLATFHEEVMQQFNQLWRHQEFQYFRGTVEAVRRGEDVQINAYLYSTNFRFTREELQLYLESLRGLCVELVPLISARDSNDADLAMKNILECRWRIMVNLEPLDYYQSTLDAQVHQ